MTYYQYMLGCADGSIEVEVRCDERLVLRVAVARECVASSATELILCTCLGEVACESQHGSCEKQESLESVHDA
jgi:hypothetical protein